MKNLILIILLAVTVQQAGRKKTANPCQHAEPIQQHQNTPNAPSLPPIVKEGQTASRQNQTDSSGKTNDRLWERLLDALVANWPLVIVGILGIWAALRTLRAIERQVDAMTDSERAWLIAELVPICKKLGAIWAKPVGEEWVELSDQEILEGYHLKHLLKVTNLGRTGAKIDEITLRSEFLKEDRSNLYSDDRDVMTIIGYDYAIAGNESSKILQVDVNEWKSELIEEIGDSQKTVLLYGLVTYFHVFATSQTQDCWFRYLYNPKSGEFKRVSPKEKEYDDRDKKFWDDVFK